MKEVGLTRAQRSPTPPPAIQPPSWVTRLEENIAGANVKLTPEDLQEVRAEAEAADATNGERYPPGSAVLLFGDTPLP